MMVSNSMVMRAALGPLKKIRKAKFEMIERPMFIKSFSLLSVASQEENCEPQLRDQWISYTPLNFLIGFYSRSTIFI